MNYQLLTGPELSQTLQKELQDCSGQSGSPQLAVAFWGKGAANKFHLTASAKIVCNLTSGGTNPDEIEKLIQTGAQVRQHNLLHAKIGCLGDRLSFVGSSNMSANGLGDEADASVGWEESNVVFDGIDPAVQARFETIWNASTEITDKCLVEAKAAWRSRQKANRSHSVGEKTTLTFLQALKQDPDYFEAHNTHVVVYEAANKKEKGLIEAGNEVVASKYGSDFDVYLDWDDLPADAILLDFCIPSTGLPAFVGVYHRNPEFPDFEEGDDNYQVTYEKAGVAGYGIAAEEKVVLRKAVSAYLKAQFKGDRSSRFFKVSELAQYLD